MATEEMSTDEADRKKAASSLYGRINHVESELGSVKATLAGQGRKLDETGVKLDSQGEKIDAILRALARSEASQPWNLRDLLGIASQGTFLFGALVSGIVYLSSSIYAKDLAVAQYRIEQLEKVHHAYQSVGPQVSEARPR